MLVSSIGDWAGIIAVTALVARLAGASGAAYAVAGVMIARLVPLLVFGPFAGVLVDRWNRRTLMVAADCGRAALYALLPLVGLRGIFVASFFIEALALLWGPSLEASLPTIVSTPDLPRANSINLLTSYATLPIGALLFTVSAALAGTLHGAGFLGSRPEALALWVDAATFAVSALILARLRFGAHARPPGTEGRRGARDDLVDEWRWVRAQTRVRALVGSLLAAFAAAGAMTALGPVFVLYTLGAGESTYGAVIVALGLGLAGGMTMLIRHSGRWRLDRQLTWSLSTTAACLGLIAVSRSWIMVVGVTFALGAAGGTAWVSGYSQLQEEVADEYRGRTFALLTVSARVVLLTSRVVFPALAGTVGTLTMTLGARALEPDGTRMALALAALVALGGAMLSRKGREAGHPSGCA
jgi:dTMP kinase